MSKAGHDTAGSSRQECTGTDRMPGFAVVDVETTGLDADGRDRIIEVAIVHLSASGAFEGLVETLVDPGRSIASQRVHGITPDDLVGAPSFEQIADDLRRLLGGRIPVAHNARFDGSFLRKEFALVGLQALRPSSWVCTMRLARSYLPGRRSLANCCSAIGHRNGAEHRAAADALAAAALLNHYLAAGWTPSGALPWPGHEDTSPRAAPAGWRSRNAEAP